MGISNSYALNDTIGKGAFGTVQKATIHATKAVRAVKVISKSKMKGKWHILEKEIDICKAVDHPSICKLYEIFEDENFLYLVMEFCAGGELNGYINNGGASSEDQAAVIMKQVLRAVAYLHSNFIAHRDIKAANILCTCNLRANRTVRQLRNCVRVCDFGLACRFTSGQELKARVGTRTHM